MTAGNGATATREADRIRVLPWVAFAPYAIVSLVHVWAKLVDDATLDSTTKPMLMPVLVIGFWFALPSLRGVIAVFGGLGILLSWGGDVFLMDPGSTGFLVGLGFFLAAHIAYLVLFLRGVKTRPMSPTAIIGYSLWWFGLLALLAPHLGSLLIPVAAYGLVLGAMAAIAVSCNAWIGVGGALFVVSDSVLGVNRFHPEIEVPAAGLVIMLTYLLAQGLIAWGVVREARRRAVADATLEV